AAVGARVAADLCDPVARGHRVDPAAALDQLVLGRCAVGGDEDLVLALGADRGGGDLDVLARERFLCAQAEVDLLGDGNRERVALERRAELATRRLEGRELAAVAARRRLRKGGRLASGRLGALVVESPVAGEPPGAADEHAHADPLGLLVVEPLDAAVPRSDHLGAAHDDARIRVRGPGAECGGHGVLAKVPHCSVLYCGSGPDGRRGYNGRARWWRNW